jgi:hypothetical protein
MPSSLLIEAWINPLLTITPSLVVHNLELIGIQLLQPFTVTVDRGHYDCAGTNYAVIAVETPTPIQVSPSSVCCSFFSHSVTRDTDPGALYPHWLGNCYVHVGATAAMCSYRHEAGRAKTWNLAESVSYKKNTNDPKDHVRIVQLQKKALLLRTELDVWKAEVRDLKAELSTVKAELSTVKAEQVGLAQRHREQDAWVKRANHCMQDWTNQQVIERIQILEQTQQTQPPKKCKKCKCKAQKKEIKQLTERLVLLENVNCDATASTQACNPFDFKEIWDNYADMPALDLIANHYTVPDAIAIAIPDSSDSDDDCFIQVVVEK